MSLPVTVTFMLADWIAKGLKDGTFERVGGVIREVASKKIVTWLRDNRSLAPQAMSFATNPVTGVLNLIVSGANTAISTKGFADVNRRLGGIEQDLGVIGQSLQVTQGILQITTAASVLNLGVSVMGFAVISQRINEIENQLKQAAELLNKINRKIDLSFYANFHAGIELALNAFTMTRVEKEAYKRLPQVFEVMQSMIETNRRFESYQTEVQAISQLGISFHDWLKLTPSTEIKPDGAELMYIIPSKPLELQPSI